MGQGEDKSPVRLEEFGHGSKQGFNVRHVKKCYVGEGSVVCLLSERKELLFVRCVDHVIGNQGFLIAASFGFFNQVRGEVKGSNLCAEGCEAA